jgi:hypothetical protein
MSAELPNKNARLTEQSKQAIAGVFELIAGNSQKGTIELAQSKNLKLEEKDYKEVGEAWQSATKKAAKQITTEVEKNPKTSENFNKLVDQTDNPDIQKTALLKNQVLNKLFKTTLKKAVSQEPAFQKPLLKELFNNQEKQQSKNQEPEQKLSFAQKIKAERENTNEHGR